jgi:hypothetical protein
MMGYKGGGAYSGGGGVLLPGRLFHSANYYPPMLHSTDANMSPTQDVEYCCRFEVGAATTFDRIGLQIVTNIATAVVRLGIRSDDGTCYPSTLVLDAGTIDAATTGFKTITISQLLAPGRYWVSATMQVTTGVAWISRGVDPMIGYTSGNTTNACTFSQSSITGALPASFSATVTTLNSNGPKILMRAA